MKVDRGRWGTKSLPIRIVCAAVVLMAGAGLILGWSPRSLRTAQKSQAPSFVVEGPTGAGKLPTPASNRRFLASLSKLPLRFEANVGQADASVKFFARGNGYSLFLTSDGATMSLRDRSSGQRRTEFVRMKLAGANQTVAVSGTDLLPGRSNYFIGNDPSRWHRNVPQFARVKYENVYPGIDLVFYGNPNRLEYDFRVAPGANPSQAELEFDGPERVELSAGNLILENESGRLQFEAPQIYQQIEGRRQRVAGRFVLQAANRVGFEIGAYDQTQELVIDPTFSYATMFGGTGDETSASIAVDGSGNIYLAGTTDSPPTIPPFPPATTLTENINPLPPGTHVFVAKILPNASNAVYETFLGGNGIDTNQFLCNTATATVSPTTTCGVGIAVDAAGNAYIAGNTTSSNFPTSTSPYQTAPKTSGNHVFVSVLNSAGSTLIYSSYLSGNGTDTATGIAIDTDFDLFVTGTTTSTDQASPTDAFPAAGTGTAQKQPFQPLSRATTQFFVTKVNIRTPGINGIFYSTYFGGATVQSPPIIAIGGGIAVDSTGNIYFSGTTNFENSNTNPSTDFPILNAYQPCLNQVPTVVSPPPACSNSSANSDAFVAKLNPNTSQSGGDNGLMWSTYFGGAQTDFGNGIAIDTGAANVYITGTTDSTDFIIPTTTGNGAAFQLCLNNNFASSGCGTTVTTNTDAYVAKLTNPAEGTTTTNVALSYFSYLGGSNNETGTAIAVDNVGNALITGTTNSPNVGYPSTPTAGSFPVTTGAIQSNLANPASTDAFFARINTVATTSINPVGSYVTYFGGTSTTTATTTAGTGVAIDSSLNSYFAGDTNTTTETTASALQTSNAGGFDTFAVKLGTAAVLDLTGVLTLGVGQTMVSAGNPATFTYTITNPGPDVATNIAFSDNFSPNITGVTLTFGSASITSGTCPTTATNNSVTCGIPTLQAGSTSTVTMSLTPAAGGFFNGGSAILIGSNNIVLNETSVSGQASDFSLIVSPSNQSVPAAGATTSYTATLTPLPVYSSSISINCSTGLPSASTCTASSSSITLNGPMAVTLNVTTTARPVTTVKLKFGRRVLYALWMGIPGMALLGFGMGTNRRRRIAGILMAIAVFGVLLVLPACGGGTTPAVVGGTPAGTYTITVTATSGTLSHSQNVTLTVP